MDKATLEELFELRKEWCDEILSVSGSSTKDEDMVECVSCAGALRFLNWLKEEKISQ
jgi:hypothetical protein